MLSFFSKKQRQKDENRNQMQFIQEQLKSIETGQREWQLLFEESMHRLEARQKKCELAAENVQELIESHEEAFLSKEKIVSKEKLLAGCILNYEEALYQMARIIRQSGAAAPEWTKQLDILIKQQHNKIGELDLSIIGSSNAPVDFRLHEIVGIKETVHLENKDLICEVIVPGLIYQGEVLKKAKIIAYKLQEGTEE